MRRSEGRAARAAWVGAWCAASLLTTTALAQPSPLAVTSERPPAHTTLRYHLRQVVSSGTGQYEDWGDSLVSVGSYSTDGGFVHATYRWQYGSPERTDDGVVTREVAFDPGTRVYTSGQTDLDDYDHATGPLATWLWIPTTIADGDTVQILENTFVSRGPTHVDVAGATRSAIQLHGEGTGTRDDEYGSFVTTFVDDYWFDASTGMFLREERTENDQGSYQGSSAGFVMTLGVEVVDASFAPRVGDAPDDPVPDTYDARNDYDEDAAVDPFGLLLTGGICGGFVLLIVYAAYRSRRNPYRTAPFAVHQLLGGEALAPNVDRLSPLLGSFLQHVVDVARASGNVVTVATSRATKQIEGIAIDDRDARVLAVYTPDPECAEALRSAAGRPELISESRYGALPSVAKALRATGRGEPGPYAYNLYETFEIMERKGTIESVDYDTSVVMQMKDGDVAEASALAERVYLVPCEAFVRASLSAGDVAFVAKEDGRVVGMAFATVVGTSARLHTLIVEPKARSRGLGKELYRARLRALTDLGVDRVVTEVAVNNPAAMEIARAFGMQKVGEMHVQSARPTRQPIGVVRR